MLHVEFENHDNDSTAFQRSPRCFVLQSANPARPESTTNNERSDSMRAENGKQVKVQFVGRLGDGTVFGEAPADRPLQFTLGREKIIPGFAEAVQGMEPGEGKTVQVPPEKGFGNYDPDKLISFKREQFKDAASLKQGAEVVVKDNTGQEFVGRVDSFTNEAVTLDMNHPLAGQQLNFEIRLQEVA